VSIPSQTTPLIKVDAAAADRVSAEWYAYFQALLTPVLHVDVTPVGNVGGGTDNLMSYDLPANTLNTNLNGLRITCWGKTANNANAKTLNFRFGAGTFLSVGLSINYAANWKVEARIIRTAANTQAITVEMLNIAGAVINANSADNTGNETDTAAITIKCTASGTADNDVTQIGMLVERLTQG